MRKKKREGAKLSLLDAQRKEVEIEKEGLGRGFLSRGETVLSEGGEGVRRADSITARQDYSYLKKKEGKKERNAGATIREGRRRNTEAKEEEIKCLHLGQVCWYFDLERKQKKL